MQDASMLIPENTDIENVMAFVVKTASLSKSDNHINAQIAKSIQVLIDNGIETAGDLRHRCSASDWMWLTKPPFHMPMCLAELIGFLLDRRQEPTGFSSRSPIPVNQKKSKCVPLDLALYGKAPKPYTKQVDRPSRRHSLIASLEKWRCAMSEVRGYPDEETKASDLEASRSIIGNQASSEKCMRCCFLSKIRLIIIS